MKILIFNYSEILLAGGVHKTIREKGAVSVRKIPSREKPMVDQPAAELTIPAIRAELRHAIFFCTFGAIGLDIESRKEEAEQDRQKACAFAEFGASGFLEAFLGELAEVALQKMALLHYGGLCHQVFGLIHGFLQARHAHVWSADHAYDHVPHAVV